MVTISTADDDETTITTPKEVANVLKKLSGSDQSKKDLRCVCVCVCVCVDLCVWGRAWCLGLSMRSTTIVALCFVCQDGRK